MSSQLLYIFVAFMLFFIIIILCNTSLICKWHFHLILHLSTCISLFITVISLFFFFSFSQCNTLCCSPFFTSLIKHSFISAACHPPSALSHILKTNVQFLTKISLKLELNVFFSCIFWSVTKEGLKDSQTSFDKLLYH